MPPVHTDLHIRRDMEDAERSLEQLHSYLREEEEYYYRPARSPYSRESIPWRPRDRMRGQARSEAHTSDYPREEYNPHDNWRSSERTVSGDFRRGEETRGRGLAKKRKRTRGRSNSNLSPLGPPSKKRATAEDKEESRWTGGGGLKEDRGQVKPTSRSAPPQGRSGGPGEETSSKRQESRTEPTPTPVSGNKKKKPERAPARKPVVVTTLIEISIEN